MRSRYQDAVRRTDRQRDDALHDVAAVRDLCSRLEASKEKLQRQLTSVQLEEEKVNEYFKTTLHNIL